MSRVRSAGCVALALCVAASGAASAAQPTPAALHLRGSTTFLPLAQQIGEAYLRDYPGALVTMAGSGSVRAYKALLDGSAELALVDGPPPVEMAREAARRGVVFQTSTLAYSAMVAVVHPDNPVRSLTVDQLKYIFSGRIADWKMVGGKSGPIQVVIGTPTSGLTQAWHANLLGDDLLFSSRAIVALGRDKGARVAASPQAISFMVPGELARPGNQGLRVLQVNGVAATPETVRDARYPLRTAVSVVTRSTPGPAERQFIAYFSHAHAAIAGAGLIAVDHQ